MTALTAAATVHEEAIAHAQAMVQRYELAVLQGDASAAASARLADWSRRLLAITSREPRDEGR